jgi:hydrogenase-4 component F
MRTKEIEQVKGLMKVLPATGVLFLGGALAITGCPPFSLFLSEFMVLTGGLASGNYITAALYLALIVVVFAAFLYHVGRMVFGASRDMSGEKERSRVDIVIMSVLLVSVLALGLYMPAFLNDALQQIAQLFPGGGR